MLRSFAVNRSLSLAAMALAQFVFRSTNELAAWIFYAVAGLGWVLPAMPLISWMSRSDADS